MRGTRSGGSKGTPQSKKKAVVPPTLSEWEAALKEAVGSTSQGEGITVTELVEQMGCSRDRVCKYLRKLIQEGKVRPTPHGKRGESIAGRACSIPSYVFVKK